ncbi:hypothetical protein D3C72_1016020 [compost metagenome]
MVVVILEMVDVDHQQRQRAARAHGAPHFLFDRHVEVAAVGDARQAVGKGLRTQDHGLFAQQLFAAHGDGHIIDLDQAVARRTGQIDWRDGDRLLHALPAFGRAMRVQGERRLVQGLRQQRLEIVAQGLGDGRGYALVAQFRIDGKEILAQHGLGLARRVARHPVVPQYDAVLFVEHDGAQVDGAEYALEQGESVQGLRHDRHACPRTLPR